MPPKKTNKALAAINRVNRTPRRKFRGSLGGDGRVSSRWLSQSVATAAAAQAYGWIPVNPPRHTAANDPGAAVLLNYSNYRVLTSKFIYIPAVGTTTTGTIWVAYIDNPEMIYKTVSGTYTYSTLVSIVQGMSTAKAGPIWEMLEVNMNKPPRRKMFNVDAEQSTNAEVAERTHQGMWIYVTTSCPFSTVCGSIQEEYTAIGENLQPSLYSGI